MRMAKARMGEGEDGVVLDGILCAMSLFAGEDDELLMKMKDNLDSSPGKAFTPSLRFTMVTALLQGEMNRLACNRANGSSYETWRSCAVDLRRARDSVQR